MQKIKPQEDRQDGRKEIPQSNKKKGTGRGRREG